MRQDGAEVKQEIIESAKKKILFLPHAVQQMSRPDRMITTREVEDTIYNGEVIETYPDESRGRSCLVLRKSDNRCVHVVCAPRLEYLAIITAYIPDTAQWTNGFRNRK